jgi:metallo-beta-lactamase family protein
MPQTGSLELTFLGAAATVTGSRYLLRPPSGPPLLLDCGLFQGLKSLRLRNWEPFQIAPRDLPAIVLTHAHLDHSGYLPVLVRHGFRGPIYATPATCDLCALLLPDSGHLQEEDAEFANRHGTSRHRPAMPLYTQAEAERTLEQLVPVPFHEERRAGDATFRFAHAGHIPGAGSVTVTVAGKTILFSGDLGRLEDPLLPSPEPPPAADYLVVESTYGDRLHPASDPQDALGEAVRRTVSRGGVVVIPAFAVGRAQALLYHLHTLMARGEVPRVPVFIDSPMAADATRVLQNHPGEHKLTPREWAEVGRTATITRSVEESKAIDKRTGPMVIISASGMATGGRVLFHLERFAPDHRNTVLLVGHQAVGTRGDQLLHGERRLKIHGKLVEVRAEVVSLGGLSAHADADEILTWLKGFARPPARTFITHGEPRASDALRRRIQDELGWSAHAPEHLESVRLD